MSAPNVVADLTNLSIERLLDDIGELLQLHFPIVETGWGACECERTASITIKADFKPEEPATETKPGKPRRVEVTARSSISAPIKSREASFHNGQLSLEL
jgi:hypothetical protein